MRSLFSLTALALVSVSLIGCGSAAEEPAPVSTVIEPISGGQSDPYHTSVLGMFTMSGYGGGMCSGTLIAPNLVLTARHCISQILGDSDYVVCGQSPFGAPYSGSNIYVTNDLKMSQYSDNWWQGSEVRVPEEGNDTCGFDVALVILQNAVPESVTKPYVPRIDVDPEVNEIYQAVGYGSTGVSYGGSRMVRGNLTVQCAPGTCSWGVASTEWRGETGICQGDSGGPALDMNDKVIGVVSRGSDGCDTPVYGGVSTWRDWIMEVALEAAAKGGYDPPFWALTGKSDPEPPPEPGTGGAGGGAGGEGGSGGSSGSVTEPDPQGRACSADVACPSGYLCLGDSSGPFCAAACDPSNACGGGLSCTAVTEQQSVCLSSPESGSESSGGCAVSASGDRGPAKPVPWVVALSALALFGARRRRRR